MEILKTFPRTLQSQRHYIMLPLGESKARKLTRQQVLFTHCSRKDSSLTCDFKPFLNLAIPFGSITLHLSGKLLLLIKKLPFIKVFTQYQLICLLLISSPSTVLLHHFRLCCTYT